MFFSKLLNLNFMLKIQFDVNNFLFICVFSLITILLVVISVAFFVLFERKFMASVQRRKGPNVAGFYGIFQSLADALKLIVKEIIIPQKSNKILFLCAPLITFFFSLLGWAVIPFSPIFVISDLQLGILYIFTILAFNTYGVVLASWASNSKYPLLAAFRSVAQSLSYELSIGIILITVCICAGSLNITNIILSQNQIWFIFPLFPMALCFLVCLLAETNRTPFDLPEAEAELVAGYNLEYSGIVFAFFFLGEYSNMLFMSTLFSTFFLGGWLPFFNFLPFTLYLNLPIKISFLCIFFILTRSAFPRYRYDQLLDIGWKVLLPFNFAYLIFTISIVYVFNLHSSHQFFI